MMKKLLALSMILFLAGCSCSTTSSQPTASPSAKPTATPSASPSASPDSLSNSTKSYIDYLSGNYTLNNPSVIENLDGNAMEGYTFGYDSADLYLLRFDRSNETASKWLEEAQNNGYIEVKIGDKMQKYYAVVNQDYMLLYENEKLDSGFREYFQNYDYHNPTNSNTN